MKNNYSVIERNRIVEEHLWCVKAVMKQNISLIRAARLEQDDVYQDLCVRLIRAVINYDPEKGDLRKHIFCQLRYELLNCTCPYRMTGMTGAPKSFRKEAVASLDAYATDAIVTFERRVA